jgi:hypothetical protein
MNKYAESRGINGKSGIMANPVNPGFRMCRQCKRTKWWDPDEAGGQWYIRRVQRDDHGEQVTVAIPSSYCRKCENEKRVVRRHVLTAIASIEATDPVAGARIRARYTRGPCSCCKRQKMGRDVKLELCRECFEAVDQCFKLSTPTLLASQVAEVQWEKLSEHLIADIQISIEVAARRDRPRGNHEFSVDPPAAHHAQCQWLEKLWRMVWDWLRRWETMLARLELANEDPSAVIAVVAMPERPVTRDGVELVTQAS